MRYAAIYPVEDADLRTPRRAKAAFRIALFMARRAARRDGRHPISGTAHLDLGTPIRVNGIALFDDERYAIRAEIEVA